MSAVVTAIFHDGFFASAEVRQALLIGGIAAIVAAVVGVPTLIRGQAFVGAALGHVSSAGGALAPLIGISAFAGFLLMSALTGGALESLPPRQARERDLLTGAVLGAALGLTSLFLYLDISLGRSSGSTITVLFGSLFVLPRDALAPALISGVLALILTALFLRQILLTALDPDLAAVQGIRLRRVGLAHLVTLTLAVALAALTVGAILSTALLVLPAAGAISVTARPGRSLLIAAATGLAGTWGGILLAYDSYDWTGGQAWPVSFCIVATLAALRLALALASGRPHAGRAG